MPDGSSYERDFYLWTQEQARRLREAGSARTNLPLDFENLAEGSRAWGTATSGRSSHAFRR